MGVGARCYLQLRMMAVVNHMEPRVFLKRTCLWWGGGHMRALAYIVNSVDRLQGISTTSRILRSMKMTCLCTEQDGHILGLF
jgi:hypothetical protein